MPCCSTCGQELPEKRLLIDLNSNHIILGGRTVKLRPLDAEVLKVLQDAAPRFVTPRQIEDRVLGLESEERCAQWLRVRISLLRKRLTGLPLSIINRHGVGYCLKEHKGPLSV
jgi:DNA-binding response OmpR family regulator